MTEFHLHRDWLNHKKSIWKPQVGFGQRVMFELTLLALLHQSLCNFLRKLELFALGTRILLKHNFTPLSLHGLHVNYIFQLSISLVMENSLLKASTLAAEMDHPLVSGFLFCDGSTRFTSSFWQRAHFLQSMLHLLVTISNHIL